MSTNMRGTVSMLSNPAAAAARHTVTAVRVSKTTCKPRQKAISTWGGWTGCGCQLLRPGHVSAISKQNSYKQPYAYDTSTSESARLLYLIPSRTRCSFGSVSGRSSHRSAIKTMRASLSSRSHSAARSASSSRSGRPPKKSKPCNGVQLVVTCVVLLGAGLACHAGSNRGYSCLQTQHVRMFRVSTHSTSGTSNATEAGVRVRVRWRVAQFAENAKTPCSGPWLRSPRSCETRRAAGPARWPGTRRCAAARPPQPPHSSLRI